MRFFKVYQDFKRFVPIDETELEKAVYAFLEGSGAVFEWGAISKIESIVPDLHRSLGWNADYVPNQDDNSDLERVRQEYVGIIGETKNKIHYLKETKQTHLVGKNVEIPKIENKISEETKQLSEKLRLK